MPDIANMPVFQDDSVRFFETESSVVKRDLWPQSAPRTVPYTPSHARTLDLKIVAVRSPANAVPAPHAIDREQAGRKRLRGSKLASLIVSVSAFIAWFLLMLAVAATNGGILAFAAITAVPFVAHIVSVWLTSDRAPRDLGAKLES